LVGVMDEFSGKIHSSNTLCAWICLHMGLSGDDSKWRCFALRQTIIRSTRTNVWNMDTYHPGRLIRSLFEFGTDRYKFLYDPLYTGPLFHPTNIGCHFLPIIGRACRRTWTVNYVNAISQSTESIKLYLSDKLRILYHVPNYALMFVSSVFQTNTLFSLAPSLLLLYIRHLSKAAHLNFACVTTDSSPIARREVRIPKCCSAYGSQ
jgi:hypothetical protein